MFVHGANLPGEPDFSAVLVALFADGAPVSQFGHAIRPGGI
jgi:hypothetical protein